MPLGLAKDSMLNLAELASKTEEDSTVEQDGSTNEPVEDYDGLLFRKVVDPDGEDDDGGLLIDGSDDVIDTEADISNPTTAFGNTLNSSNDPDMSSAASNKTDVDPKSYQYAGFQADYHDFENYTSYDYYQGDYISSGSGLQFGSDKKGQSTCWKCIFPWNYTEDEEDDEIDEYSVTDGLPVTEDQAMGTVSNNNDDGDNDEVSMISAGSGNALGGKPSEKDRQTVLAGLGSTQSNGTDESTVASDGGSESGIKGILKHASKGRDSRIIRLEATIPVKANKENRGDRYSRRMSHRLKKRRICTHRFHPWPELLPSSPPKKWTTQKKDTYGGKNPTTTNSEGPDE